MLDFKRDDAVTAQQGNKSISIIECFRVEYSNELANEWTKKNKEIKADFDYIWFSMKK